MALERPLVSILNLCIQRVGDRRYPIIRRVSSVRTDYLPSRSPPRRGTTVKAGKGHPGSQHHLNATYPGQDKNLLRPREWFTQAFYNLKLALWVEGAAGRKRLSV